MHASATRLERAGSNVSAGTMSLSGYQEPDRVITEISCGK